MDVIGDVAVVGPGAVGTTVAAYLSAAGHPVRVCGRTPRSQIELRPDGADPITVPGPVCTDPAEITGPVGVVLLAVKATQNADAARWLARLCDENTVVVVLQNGVEQVEQVQPLCASSTVIPGIVWFSAETQPDGWVRLRGEARLALPTGPAATAFAELWRGAGGTRRLRPRLRHRRVAQAAGQRGGRVDGAHRSAIRNVPPRRSRGACPPVCRANASKSPAPRARSWPTTSLRGTVEMFRQAPTDMGTSMLADREARRPQEWDIRNGVIIRKARAHGIATPISDILVPLLAAASDGPG